MEIGSGREEVLGRAGEAEGGRSPTGASPAGAVGAAPPAAESRGAGGAGLVAARTESLFPVISLIISKMRTRK